MRFFHYVRQDGISEWWKEAIQFVWECAEREQWRRIWWLIQVVDVQECGCEGDLDWICSRCWVLANARRALGANYWRVGDDASGYSHGSPSRDCVPARPRSLSKT